VMRKVSLLIIICCILFVVVACSGSEGVTVEQISDKVDEELAQDTLDVLNLLYPHVKKHDKPDFTEEEEDLLRGYVEKYGPEKHHMEFKSMYDDEPSFSVTDYQVYLRTEIIVLIFGPDAL